MEFADEFDEEDYYDADIRRLERIRNELSAVDGPLFSVVLPGDLERVPFPRLRNLEGSRVLSEPAPGVRPLGVDPPGGSGLGRPGPTVRALRNPIHDIPKKSVYCALFWIKVTGLR